MIVAGNSQKFFYGRETVESGEVIATIASKWCSHAARDKSREDNLPHFCRELHVGAGHVHSSQKPHELSLP